MGEMEVLLEKRNILWDQIRRDRVCTAAQLVELYRNDEKIQQLALAQCEDDCQKSILVKAYADQLRALSRMAHLVV